MTGGFGQAYASLVLDLRRPAQAEPQPPEAAGSLYPALSRIREVSAAIAAAVAESAYASGLADRPRPADVLADVEGHMYDPRYASYV